MEDSGVSYDFSETIFWFLDENCRLTEISSDGLLEAVEFGSHDKDEDEDDEERFAKSQESIAFWDEQEQLLQATLCRTTTFESRVRRATKEALMESKSPCGCRKDSISGGCRSCLRMDIFQRLCKAGYNCSISKSKWNSSSLIPSGEHTYLEVSERKEGGEPVRVIVELHFKAEFEMARASDEYNRLVSRLPEVFVGKADRIRSLVKILCGAAKKCMKEKKMHMAPWRKQKYMEAKWLSASAKCELSSTAPAKVAALPVAFSSSGDRPRKPRASMLTFALLENLPQNRCQAVAVG